VGIWTADIVNKIIICEIKEKKGKGMKREGKREKKRKKIKENE
jgi:hypothetical protein